MTQTAMRGEEGSPRHNSPTSSGSLLQRGTVGPLSARTGFQGQNESGDCAHGDECITGRERGLMCVQIHPQVL